MSLYREKVLPVLIEHVMRSEFFAEQRRLALADAKGVVLEIGFGTGLNVPFYPAAVSELIALDPVRPPQKYVDRHLPATHLPLTFIRGEAENLPLSDASVDFVVSTWTLCSIVDPAKALAEIDRVLKPGGSYLFLEHGLAPERWVARVQHTLTPLQKRVAGGCHLDRKIDELVRSSSLTLAQLETYYMRGPKLLTYLYRGRAEKRQ